MKTRVIFWMISGLFLLITARSSYAQEVVGRADTLPAVVITTTSLVSQKVTDAFNRSFKDAVSPRWYHLNKNYLVKFIENEQKNSALYDSKGYLIYHISYGNESNLPYDVSPLVKSEYPTYKIITAIHVNQADRDIWVVNLESNKDWVMARVEDGDLQEVDRFKKAAAN